LSAHGPGFVIRARTEWVIADCISNAVDTSTGLRSDQIISLNGFYAAKKYPDKLRRVRFYDSTKASSLFFDQSLRSDRSADRAIVPAALERGIVL